MADIPIDIWLNIVQFIPDDQLSNLFNVNNFFFELGMDIRYRKISISSRKPWLDSKKILDRICDPTIGRRVRNLHIELTHTKLDKSGMEARSLAKQLTQRFTTALHRAVRIGGQSNARESSFGHTANNLKSITPASFTRIIELLIDTLPRLKNVTEFSLDSWDLPATYHLQSFFPVVWSSFGHNLRSLSVGANFQGCRTLIASNPPTDLIREMKFEFTNNLHRNIDVVEDTEILLNDIAPFLNNRLGPQLESLRILSWATIDISLFLAKLGPFPQLKNLSIRASFKRAIPSLPVDVFNIVRNTAPTLQKLQLRLNPLRISVGSGVEESLGQGLHLCLSDVRAFPNLRVLDIYYTPLNVGVDALATVIKNSAEHLSFMIFRDHYLHPYHIEPLVSALSFCKHLYYLRLCVWKMDANLFDLLAKNLPNLHSLSIFQGGTFAGDNSPEFRDNMQGRWYPDWKLRSIDIWGGGARWDYEAMSIFSECIPSVDV